MGARLSSMTIPKFENEHYCFPVGISLLNQLDRGLFQGWESRCAMPCVSGLYCSMKGRN